MSRSSDREMRRALRVVRQQETKRQADVPRRVDRGAADRVKDLAFVIAAASLRREPEDIQPTPAPAQRLPRAPQVDFDAVPPHHYAIDARLRNWGTWCNGTAAASSSPMFRLSQSSARARGEVVSAGTSIDRTDAVRVARAVTALPPKHAAALNWSYVKPVNPRKACDSIGTTMQGLSDLLHEGRQMLINRGM